MKKLIEYLNEQEQTMQNEQEILEGIGSFFKKVAAALTGDKETLEIIKNQEAETKKLQDEIKAKEKEAEQRISDLKALRKKEAEDKKAAAEALKIRRAMAFQLIEATIKVNAAQKELAAVREKIAKSGDEKATWKNAKEAQAWLDAQVEEK